MELNSQNPSAKWTNKKIFDISGPGKDKWKYFIKKRQ